MTTPFESGRLALATGRRTLLKAGGAGLAFSAAAGAPAALAAGAARTDRRAYVLVIDGCRPDELDQAITPNLAALRDGGLSFPRATSLPVMETIPNHTMMMSGVRPDRSGVPANSVYDAAEGVVRTLDRPSDLKAPTVLETLGRRGFTSATVLSKEYLYGIFGERATYRWEPSPTLPVTEHAPDRFTMAATTAMIDDHDPHLVFTNLGDIDRFGHADVTGPLGVRALRRLALADTDLLIGDLVSRLQQQGRWEQTMLVVLADHSMDWSSPDQVVSLAAPLEADPLLAGNVQIADNGGADLLYWTGPPARRAAAIKRMRTIARGVPGVLSALARSTPSLRLGPEAGDVVVYCQAGWRFSDPDPRTSNPIPGNHGHPATAPIPFFLAGGHPAVPKRVVSSRPASTQDVAPTVADFFGLLDQGSYDGVSRLRVR